MAVSSTLQNLYVDIQGSTEGAKPGDDPVERVITIRNLGDRAAEVDLWIEPTDARAEPLRRWGVFDKADIKPKMN